MAVYENFPYTNVHELNLNWIVKNMKQLLEDWDAFTTNVDATAQSGSSAGVEVIGSLKEGLTFKFTLPKGDKGNNGDTGNGIDTVLFNPNYSLTFNFTNGTSYTTPSLRGAQGEGLKINDTYPTLQALKQAHPTGVEGDAYLIGTDPNFVLYIWSTRLNDYALAGALTSPQPTETTPLMDGVASTGDEYAYARGDHRHPSDTSKLDVTTFNQSIADIIEDINTIEGNITTLQNTKQDNLTAGNGINISNNVISSLWDADLLWTNSTPSSPIDTLTVPVNLTNYNYVLIEFCQSISNTSYRYSVITAKANTAVMQSWYKMRRRLVDISNTAISFQKCYQYDTYAGSEVEEQSQIIPLRIYGIR